LQVKNKPYRLGEEYAFILENGAVANMNLPTINACLNLQTLGEKILALMQAVLDGIQ
jgi:hypothetical protein